MQWIVWNFKTSGYKKFNGIVRVYKCLGKIILKNQQMWLK